MAHLLRRAPLVALTLIAVLAVPIRAVRAAAPAVVAISPASSTATVGDDVELDITVANVPEQPGIGGYLIVLTWDSAVLSLSSLADTGWVTSGNVVTICSAAVIDNAAGGAAADCSPALAFGPGVSTSAPRALAHAIFHASAPGTTSIRLTGGDLPSNLLNSSNGDIAATFVDGAVTVTAPPAAAAVTDTPAAEPSSTPRPATATTGTSTATVHAPDTPLPALTVTPASQTTSAAIAQTPSTKPTQGTLSKVEVPPTGSGAPPADNTGIAWWVPALVTAGAVLLAIGGVGWFRWTRRRTR